MEVTTGVLLADHTVGEANEKFWKVTGDREDHNGSQTHSKHWNQLEQTWRQVLFGPCANGTLNFRHWKDFEQKVAKHRRCGVEARCGACGAGYCNHLKKKHLYLDFAICTLCDTWLYPNPFNPKCTWLVDHFICGMRWGEPEGQDIDVYIPGLEREGCCDPDEQTEVGPIYQPHDLEN